MEPRQSEVRADRMDDWEELRRKHRALRRLIAWTYGTATLLMVIVTVVSWHRSHEPAMMVVGMVVVGLIVAKWIDLQWVWLDSRDTPPEIERRIAEAHIRSNYRSRQIAVSNGRILFWSALAAGIFLFVSALTEGDILLAVLTAIIGVPILFGFAAIIRWGKRGLKELRNHPSQSSHG